MNTYRPHFFMIFKTFFRLLFLLLFPFIRILFSFKDINAWVQVLTMEIILICIIILFSFFKWFYSYYYIDNDTFCYTHGIFIKKTDYFPSKNIAASDISSNPFFMIFRALVIQFDTIGGLGNKFDFKILIYQNQLPYIKECISIKSKAELKHNIPIYKPKFYNILLLSLSSSNFALGFLLSYAFLSKMSKITGEYLSKLIFDTLNEFSQKALFGIPPAISFLGYLFLLGWGISFISLLLKYSRFSLYNEKNNLNIIRGVFWEHNYVIKKNHINTVKVRQTLFMKILGICSIYVKCAGFGKQKGELSVIIPCIEEFEIEEYTLKVFPNIKSKNPSLKPNEKAHFRFLFTPLLYITLTFTAGVIGNSFLSNILKTETTIILWTAFFIIIFCLWWLIIRELTYRYSGISIGEKEIILNRGKILGIESIFIPREKIQKIIISQNIFQRFNKICDITITALSSDGEKYKVKNLDLEKSKALFNMSKTD